MKKRYKKKIRYTNIIPFILCILVLGLSIGFSAFEEQMLVTDLVADIRLKQDIRVTNVTINNVSPNTVSQSLDYNKSNISDTVTLPNSDSTITYTVEITNIENSEMGIYDLTLSNSNLDYTIDNYTKKDKLCDDNNNLKCNLGSKSTLQITIFYKENMYNENNIDQTFILDFDFRGFYTITYTDIPGNYQSTIMGGETLIVDFGENAPDKLLIYMGETRLTDQDYTYQNNILTLTNVDGSIRILSYLPSEYQEVEYIESTGTQYIDTEFVGNGDTRVKMDIQVSENPSINAITLFGYWNSKNMYRVYYKDQQYKLQYGSDTIPIQDIQTNRVLLDLNKNNLYINNALVASATYQNISNSLPIYLFTSILPNNVLEWNSNISIRLYSCQIYDDEIEIRNFAPCYRKSDNKPGLYDIVNRKFYINSNDNSFDFMIGPTPEDPQSEKILPNQYAQVEYIQSNGKQYINTGYYPDGNTNAKYKVNILEYKIYGPHLLSSKNYYFPFFRNRNNSLLATRGADGTQVNNLTFSTDTIYEFEAFWDNNIVVNGNNFGKLEIKGQKDTVPLYLGTYGGSPAHTNYTSSAKFYYCKIYDENTLVRDFIPCYRKPDNKPGMFDLVNKIFYTNSGTGEDFIVGQEVE